MLVRAKRLLEQTAVYGVGNLLLQAFRFILLPVYGQFLTTADYGVLSVVGTLNAALAIFFQLGLQGAVTRFHYDYQDDEHEQRSYYGTVWIFLTAVSLGLTLLFVWRGEALFRLLFREVPFHPYGELSLWIAFANVASVIPLVLFRVREQAPFYALSTVGLFLSTSAAIIFFVVVLKQGAVGSLRGQLLATGGFALIFTVISLRNSRLTFDWSKLKDSLAFALPIIPHQLSGWALAASDRVLVERYVSLDQVGVYSLGYRFGMILDIVLSSINLAWAPFFYKMAAEESGPRTFARLTTYYTAGIVTLGLGVAGLAKDVIVVMAKPAFHQAFQVVPVVVLAFLAHGFYYMTVNQLFYTKQTKKLPLFTTIAALVNVGLNLLLLPRFGIMAAAWNTVVGYVLLFVLVFVEAQKVYPIHYEYRRLLVLLGAAGGAFPVVFLVDLGNPYLNIAVKSLLILALPAVLFLFRFFTAREIEGMRLLLQQIKQRFLGLGK